MKIELIEGWHKLAKAWSMQVAALGVVAPDVLNLVAENINGVALLDDGLKSTIRLVCLVAVVLLRPIKQGSVSGDAK